MISLPESGRSRNVIPADDAKKNQEGEGRDNEPLLFVWEIGVKEKKKKNRKKDDQFTFPTRCKTEKDIKAYRRNKHSRKCQDIIIPGQVDITEVNLEN